MTRSPAPGVQAPSRRPGMPRRAASVTDLTATDENLDPALALLQQYQAGQISTGMIGAAESRLRAALDQAGQGRPADPGLLLRQIATDLGITLDLAPA